MNMLMMIRRILQESNQDNGGGSPPASTPAPVPSTPASEPSSSPGSGDDFDFGALVDYHEKGGVDAPKGETAPPSSAAPKTAPVVPPVAPSPPALPGTQAPPAPPAAAASPPVAPQQSPQGQPPAQGAQPPNTGTQPPAPAASAEPPAQPQMTFEQHRKEFLPKLQELYTLTPEEAEQMKENPGAALPQLAARLHYETQLATYNAVMAVMPQMVGLLLDQRASHDRANNEFYSAWPKLQEAVKANPQAEGTIRSAISAIRAANPKITQAELVKQAGYVSMVTLGLPLEMPAASAPAAPVAPAAPPRPAGIGAVGHIPTPTPGDPAAGDEGNIFSDLAAHWDAGNGQ